MNRKTGGPKAGRNARSAPAIARMCVRPHSRRPRRRLNIRLNCGLGG